MRRQVLGYIWSLGMQNKKIEVKGIKDGLLIKIGSGKWAKQEKALLEHINAQKDFFQGGRLALDVGNHILKAATLGALRDTLSDSEVKLWAVLSDSPTTEKTAQALGLATQLTKPTPTERRARTAPTIQGDKALLLRRTFRSGQSVKHPGHIIVLGDVNPGAEIIAGGSIIVWGHLRGVAHAGAKGDSEAVVCALDLSPTQLRIADRISVSPPGSKEEQPETARLEDGQVVAHPWHEV
ncbi:MAG: putative septum site-determining protein MinC [Chloroflexi bacterium]|nr:putative septum site-determining protein MinC [Chloroflexota bacterium]